MMEIVGLKVAGNCHPKINPVAGLSEGEIKWLKSPLPPAFIFLLQQMKMLRRCERSRSFIESLEDVVMDRDKDRPLRGFPNSELSKLANGSWLVWS
jgi:hypothetical protein